MDPSPDLTQEVAQFRRLFEISRDLTSTLDLDALLNRIVQAAAELSNAQAASILLYDDRQKLLTFQAATNLSMPVMRGIFVPLEGSLAGWVIQERSPVIVTDVHQDPRFFSDVEKTTQIPTHSLIAVPLIYKDSIIGVLESINKTKGSFSEQDLEILMVLASQAAVAIENTRLFHQSDLIAELVHELRTPLSAVLTAAHLLQREMIGDTERVQLSKMISGEAGRLNDLATTFLEMAWLESGRAEFRPTSFDLLDLLRECYNEIQAPASVAGLRTELTVPPVMPRVQADRNRLKQVVVNLLSNAVKYNQPGGSIALSAAASQEAKISVMDTGIGIPIEAQGRLFEKFYRVQGSDQVASGIGLGLSICKQIIHSMGGRIEVHSEPGKGSEFIVYLPTVE